MRIKSGEFALKSRIRRKSRKGKKREGRKKREEKGSCDNSIASTHFACIRQSQVRTFTNN